MIDERDETLTGDEALLKEIRDRYAYALEKWKDIREERRIDLRYVCGDPWSDTDRKARENKDNPRPCISHDELGQYVNHAVNNARQNKRGIKIDPLGDSTEKDAELRQDIIRTAEYRSRAQSAYLTAYQAMLEGSYGFFGIGRRYVENANLTAANFNHQELWFRTFSNPNAVLPDPDCKEPDWSDQGYCFVLDPITREDFKRQHPRARIQDFSAEQQQIAKDWLQDRLVLRAEYWKITTTETKKYLVGGQILDALPKGVQADHERTIVKRSVTQYITNGVEILKKTPQPGTMIPIIPVTGLERYVDEGAGPKRKLFSLVRLARDPQLTLAFLCSQEMEEAGLTPKVPFMGYVGQFETDREAWENITKIARGFIQADPMVDQATGQVLPLPTREQFTPNFQSYEVAKDGARRAIQAAMGISPLPTAAQRSNEKSGIALERIETAQDIGSYHFVDGLERAMMYGGRVANEYIGAIHVDEQEMMLRKADDSNRHVRVNTEEPYLNETTKEMEHFPIDDGSHTVTISSGPSDASQRAEVKEFIDSLLKNLQSIPAPPPVLAQIVAMAIRMKGLGPKGDQLADLIAPPNQGQQQMPPEAQQAIQQLKQQHDALNAYAQQLEQKMQQLQLEKMAKVIDNQARMDIEKLKLDAQLAGDEINTKAQNVNERIAFLEDVWKQLHGQAHDAALQAADHAHAADQQESQQQAAAEQQQQAAEQQPEPAAA